jgi:hypothetical protein
MRNLAQHTGLPINSRELFLRATVKADPLTGPIFDPAVLHTFAGFTGLNFFIGYPGHPNFGWVTGLNNNVSSLRGAGALGLFSGTWFNGASRLFLGPFFSNANLATVGFNNSASSALVD